MKAKLHIQSIDIEIDVPDEEGFDLKEFLHYHREQVNEMVIIAMDNLHKQGAQLVKSGTVHFNPAHN